MEIDLINRTGTIVLKSDHSMFVGNKPNIVTSEMYSSIIPELFKDTKKESLERFGLFDSSTPNYTTYYPDVKAEDLIPKEEDFIYPIFRALSATIVWKGYKPIDFSKPGVLKASAGLLIGQTVNADHETALGNGMGVVRSTAWQESYVLDGVKVPSGINAEFMIDGKSNPRIARGIQSKPPIIHSNSVGVRFEWEPSHTLKDNNEFFSKLGSRDDKGELYRLIVTKILQYTETSLVAHGADPYAQIITDGKINNAKYASGVYNFSTDTGNGVKKSLAHYIDYKMDLTLEADSAIPVIFNNDNNNNKTEKSMEILKTLELILGLAEGSLKEDKDDLDAALAKFAKDKSDTDNSSLVENLRLEKEKVTTLTSEKTDLETKLQTAISEKASEEVLAKATKIDNIILEKRNDAKKFYALAKGTDKKDTVITLLDTCEESVLESLLAEYRGEAELKFPDSCKKCGSHDISKASAFVADTDEDDEDVTKLSFSEKKEFLRNKNKKRSTNK